MKLSDPIVEFAVGFASFTCVPFALLPLTKIPSLIPVMTITYPAVAAIGLILTVHGIFRVFPDEKDDC